MKVSHRLIDVTLFLCIDVFLLVLLDVNIQLLIRDVDAGFIKSDLAVEIIKLHIDQQTMAIYGKLSKLP